MEDSSDWCPLTVGSHGRWELEGLHEQPDPIDHRSMLAAIDGARESDRKVKRRLLQIVRRNAAALESLGASPRLPAHLRLLVAAEVVRESLEVLFATRGRPWVEDASLCSTFDALFGESDLVPGDAILTYLELRAAAILARRRHHGERRALSTELDLGRCQRLVSFVEREVFERYESKSQSRRRRLLSRVVRYSPVAAVALLGIGYAIYTWPESPVETLPVNARCGGLQGTYFQGVSFDKELLTRFDPSLSFDTSGKFDSRLPSDDFSARWQGFIAFPEDGGYSLCVESDDGNRVHFNGRMLIEDWQAHPVERSCATVYVEAGWYPIGVEYFEERRSAVLKLLRGPDPEHVTLVSSSDLCSNP